ncbi:DoxX-like protein [Stackebrandtia albiflava]|uniref:DoxX-like protein n=1 Tax=Stackebrandtia albiflava TaxID=406432 RepID=A0A562VGV0_9ACTN|nr:DoxX family protein [Stackebrandtia albiflava]TWJ17125.1 DoxX-like protein [Stackebrandtia albiflava]
MTTHTASATVTTTRTDATKGTARRIGHIGLWVLRGLAAAVFLFSAFPKLTASPEAVAGFAQIGFAEWFIYLLGALEVAGALGLLIRPLSGLAALCLTLLMIGAVTTQIVAFGGMMVEFPAVTGVVTAVIAYGCRHSLIELRNLLRSAR